MFQSARIKLTAWYLLIIMCISGFFSIGIYQISSEEIERVINRMQEIEARRQFGFPVRLNGLRPPSIEDLIEAQQRLAFRLLVINGIIMLISGGAAYLLAGRTLRPIKLMVDEQNRFITNASHELRTPIATLKAEMEANLLEKNISDDQARVLIKSNLEEVNDLQQLANNLLKLTQIHTNGIRQFREEFGVKELLESVIKKVTPLARQKNITINTQLHECTMKGDKNSLHEVFTILLDNAIKYSGENTEVTVTLEGTKHSVKVQIVDQGMGIAQEDLPHIFDRFYRAEKSRSQDGFGLGLAIAKKEIGDHNGSIRVNSKVGEGTVFTVEIPV